MSGASRAPFAANVFDAFPRRPLTLHPPAAPLGARIGTMLAAVFCIGILIASLVWVWPPLQSDWQVRDAARPVRGGDVSGRCHSKLIFHICDITLRAGTPRAPVKRDVTYMFVDLHIGDYTLTVMADPDHPDLLTSDLGLDTLINRGLSLFGAWIFMAAGIYLAGRSAWQSSRMRNAVMASSGQVLVGVPLTLLGLTKSRRTATWNVRDPSGATTSWTMPAAAQPFMLGGGNAVLGIAGPDNGAAFPLDAQLTWIELTEAERAAIFGAQANAINAARQAQPGFQDDRGR
jgi:hypothetical protein